MTDESSNDEGEQSLMLYFTLGPNDSIKVTFPPKWKPHPIRVVLIPRDVDFFNSWIETNATRTGQTAVFTRNLKSEFRGHSVVPITQLLKLKQGRLRLPDISKYERH